MGGKRVDWDMRNRIKRMLANGWEFAYSGFEKCAGGGRAATPSHSHSYGGNERYRICEYCKATVRATRLQKHIAKVHGQKKISVSPSPIASSALTIPLERIRVADLVKELAADLDRYVIALLAANGHVVRSVNETVRQEEADVVRRQLGLKEKSGPIFRGAASVSR